MSRKTKKLPPLGQLPSNFQAQSTWGIAHSYELAARALHQGPSAQSSLPILFLLLHSLELFLKAYLVSQGATEKELRALGHDLVACMRACKSKGLSNHLTVEKRAVVQVVRVNRYYSDKELEYFTPRAKRFGSIDMLDNTVQGVAKGILVVILGQAWGALYPTAA